MTGYTFVEWNTEPDGSGTAYKPGDTASVDADTKLYAFFSDSIWGFSYLEDSDSYSIRCTDKTITSCNIPSSYKGKSVSVIEENAFIYCDKLESINIPNGVESIGKSAFSNCKALVSITIPEGIKSIEESTFLNCISLVSIILPDSVKTIGPSAFEGCIALGSVTIPSSVDCIDKYAFYNCLTLKTINFHGTVEQWNSITKEPGWKTGTDSYTIRCTDGTITETT